MTTYTITKERNILTITVDGATVKTKNALTAGKFAGQVLVRKVRYGSRVAAEFQAKKHAILNGWAE